MSTASKSTPASAARWTRRGALALLPLALAACAQSRPLPAVDPMPFAATPAPVAPVTMSPLPNFGSGPSNETRYGANGVADEPFPVKPVSLNRLDQKFLKQTVPNDTGEGPGTIVIDPHARFLYLVQDDGTAIRYGVGVGREGFAWNGQAYIRRKLEWPDWHPPAEMVARDPHARPYKDGMPGGPGNPLGARSMALWQGDKDTLFRIHGTVEPYSIGKAVSSGCIRMLNQDVIDLYSRVPLGTKVVVRS